MAGAALVAAAVTFLAPVAAHANNLDEETSTVTVRFGDLNLDSQKDAHRLFLRLRIASQSVCGDEHEAIDLSERGKILECQQVAIEQAVEKVGRPLLTAVYDHNYPREALPMSASLSQPTRG
jgi:UrcA family protein